MAETEIILLGKCTNCGAKNALKRFREKNPPSPSDIRSYMNSGEMELHKCTDLPRSKFAIYGCFKVVGVQVNGM